MNGFENRPKLVDAAYVHQYVGFLCQLSLSQVVLQLNLGDYRGVAVSPRGNTRNIEREFKFIGLRHPVLLALKSGK